MYATAKFAVVLPTFGVSFASRGARGLVCTVQEGARLVEPRATRGTRGTRGARGLAGGEGTRRELKSGRLRSPGYFARFCFNFGFLGSSGGLETLRSEFFDIPVAESPLENFPPYSPHASRH